MKLFDKAVDFCNKVFKIDSKSENRPYDFYLLFGNEDETTAPWLKSNWEIVFKPHFEDILHQTATTKETGIYVDKFHPEKRLAKKDNKEFIYHSEIKLGQLKWDNASHDKWTVEPNSEDYFQYFELWSPSRIICEKRQCTPEVFISISNQKSLDNKREIKFSYFAVIAIAKSLEIETKSILSELSKKANVKAAVVKSRRWGTPEKNGKWIFTNGIQDTFCNAIYNKQDLHTFSFDEIVFEPDWEILHQQR